MAEATSSTDEAHVSTTTTDKPSPKGPITSFPFPKDIKDEIYGYLLSAEKVQYTVQDGCGPESSTYDSMYGGRYKKIAAPTYKFDTAILTVSKTIGGEASKYLHEHNVFVKVNYDMPGFKCLLHTLRVPAVRDSGVDDFDKHVLDLNLLWRRNPFVATRAAHTRPTPEAESGAALLLMQDMSKLCTLLHFLCTQYHLPGAYVFFHRGEEFAVDAVMNGASSLDMVASIHRRGERAVKEAEQMDILSALGRLGRYGFTLSTTGFEEAAITTFKGASSLPSRLYHMEATDWERYSNILPYKEQAHNLAASGMLHAAAAMYSCALDFAFTLLNNELRHIMLRIDIAAELAAVLVRIGHYINAATLAESISDTFDRFYDGMDETVRREKEHLVCILEFLGKHPDGRCSAEESYGPSEILEQLSKGGSQYANQDKYGFILAHYNAMMSGGIMPMVINGRTLGSGLRVEVHKFSVFNRPLRVFDDHARVAKLVGLEDFRDGQDTKRLSELTASVKREIWAVQEKYGFPVSSFD